VLDRLTVEDFRTAEGQAFVLRDEAGNTLDLELVRARPIEPDAPAVDGAGKRTPFAVDFRGPAEPVLPQAIYRLENESLGPLEIFIVPVRGSEGATDYEAIFA
jgi:hypothetical protein